MYRFALAASLLIAFAASVSAGWVNTPNGMVWYPDNAGVPVSAAPNCSQPASFGAAPNCSAPAAAFAAPPASYSYAMPSYSVASTPVYSAPVTEVYSAPIVSYAAPVAPVYSYAAPVYAAPVPAFVPAYAAAPPQVPQSYRRYRYHAGLFGVNVRAW